MTDMRKIPPMPPLYTSHARPVPADLAMCNRCRKVVGDHDGRWGEECGCRDSTPPPADG